MEKSEKTMAKSRKTNLDYFRWVIDNGIRSDKGTFYRLHCKEQGINESWGVLLRALERIFSGEGGYYSEWNDGVAYMIARDVIIETEEAKKAINEAVKVGYFNKEMFDKYHILTSKEVQDIYFSGIKYSKRTFSEIKKDYLLIDMGKILEKSAEVREEFAENSEEFTVKENKGKGKLNESKTNDNKGGGNQIKTNQIILQESGGEGRKTFARETAPRISEAVRRVYRMLMGSENGNEAFLASLLNEYGESCVIWAIHRAIDQVKPDNRYIKGVLNGMRDEERQEAAKLYGKQTDF